MLSWLHDFPLKHLHLHINWEREHGRPRDLLFGSQPQAEASNVLDLQAFVERSVQCITTLSFLSVATVDNAAYFQVGRHADGAVTTPVYVRLEDSVGAKILEELAFERPEGDWPAWEE